MFLRHGGLSSFENAELKIVSGKDSVDDVTKTSGPLAGATHATRLRNTQNICNFCCWAAATHLAYGQFRPFGWPASLGNKVLNVSAYSRMYVFT
jgi:hypothetical protein